jgi:hypothetical protein
VNFVDVLARFEVHLLGEGKLLEKMNERRSAA